jgi:Zn-dependent protease
MPSNVRGSIHLFKMGGVDLYLNWSWFFVALFEINSRRGRYSSVAWNALEYLALFSIVLLHEFGHAMACRQVGGTANRILLWPFGGVAYVNPPQRPGANLWSIAAGPLVNVALLPLLLAVFAFARMHGWAHLIPDLYFFVQAILAIDVGLLVFNMMPVYPLDGGQILRSLLWFIVGRGRSLLVVTILSFIGIAGLMGLAVWTRSMWSGAIAVLMLVNCWGGLQHARALLRIAKLPRRRGFACPSCRSAPPLGNCWKCGHCGQEFDTFQAHAVCPYCSAQYSVTMCLDCGKSRAMHEWIVDPVAAAGVVVAGNSTAVP